MKKYNCTVRVINQKPEIMFREVLQNGVFKLISPLFLSLTDESDFLCKVFFSFVLQLFTESSLWGWMQGSKYIYFFLFFVKTYMSIIMFHLFLTTQNAIRHFFLFCNWVSISRFSRHYVKPKSKFCCTFVNISLILTNDWQLLQVCKHLLTYSPCQWWVHQSLVSPYCLTFSC